MPNGVWTSAGTRTRFVLCHIHKGNDPTGPGRGPVRIQGGILMTRTSATRSLSAILAGLALGIAVPAASARPIDSVHTSSFIAASPPPTLASSPSAASRNSVGGSTEWEIAAASGAASLALFGVGAMLLTSRRRRQRRTAGSPTVAA
jgi:hypothetical protein